MNSIKNKTANKIFLMVFIFLFFCFGNTSKVQATIWPGVDPAIQKGLDEIMKLIDGLIVGTLKQQAVMRLNIQVDMLAGKGSGGEPAFIVNWETYLVSEPQNETNLYMNDYISRMTRGRNSSSLYSTEGFSGPGNYAARLGQTAQLLSNAKNPNLTYEGDPSQMLQGGNFKNMELYLSGVNNPWGFNIAVQSEQQRVLENKRSQAMARAIAYQGFRGTSGDTSGSITNPGSLVKDALSNTQDMPNRILQSASSIPEVATALVSQMISRSITQGFVSVQTKNIKATAGTNKYNNATNKAMTTYGPAARFGVEAAKSGQ